MRNFANLFQPKRMAIAVTAALGATLAFSNAQALTITGGVGLIGGTGVIGIGNQCVQVGGVDSTGAGPVTGWSCNNNLNQVWEITNGQVIKINNGTAMCLTGAVSGGGVTLAACGTNTDQLWSLNTHGEFVNDHYGECLDWAMAYTELGPQLTLEPCNGSPQQQFWPR